MSFRLGFWVCFCLVTTRAGQTVELPRTLPPHPRLLFNQQDLAGIRARTAGPAKAYFESLKNQADEWLTREVKLPEKGGQWFHWYSCPKHGARLRTEGPTRHVCPVDQEVFTGYPYDDVVLSTEHNRLAGAIRTLGIVYQVTGEQRYATRAKQILLAYATRYRSYPLHDIRGEAKVGGGKIGPQTLDESTWLITVVEGADCVWETLSKEEQHQVRTGLLTPATDVIRQHKMGIHNIQCWKNSAVGLTALLAGDMDLLNEALNGESGYFRQMAKGVSADGPWFEGAWGYHFYTLSAVMHLAEGAYHSGVDLYGPELKRMFDAPIAMAMPDLNLPAFNDSGTVDLKGQARLYATAYARYGNPQYLLVSARGSRANEAVLLHGAQAEAPVPQFEPFSRNFSASGNAILAAGSGPTAAWLCLKYGPHGGGHGHPDKLNFVLYGLGQVIAPDPGTANYGVPIQGGWFRTTLAHNTLVVDERSQKPAEGSSSAFIATNGFSAVMAEAGPIYDGVAFRRTVALLGTNLLIFIDQVQSKTQHTYDLAYHNRGQLTDVEGATALRPPEKPGYSYLRDLRTLTSSSALRLRFEMGQGNETLWTMAGGEPTTFITGTGVGRHTEDRVPLVIARREGKSTAYLWCVALEPGTRLELKPEEVALPDGSRPDTGAAAAVLVRLNAESWILLANPGGETVAIGGQRTDAKIGLLTRTTDGAFRVQHSAK